MALYGIGCKYGDEDVCSDFIKKKLACVGWGPDEKPFFHGILKDIDIGDIILLKSFFQRHGNQVLRIKGIGIIINNKIQEIEDLGHCLDVKWVSYEVDGLIDLEFPNEEYDGGVQRRSTIYKEYNDDICKKIITLLFK